MVFVVFIFVLQRVFLQHTVFLYKKCSNYILVFFFYSSEFDLNEWIFQMQQIQFKKKLKTIKCYSVDLLGKIFFDKLFLIKNHNLICYYNYYCTFTFLLYFIYIKLLELKLLSQFTFIFFKEIFVQLYMLIKKYNMSSIIM